MSAIISCCGPAAADMHSHTSTYPLTSAPRHGPRLPGQQCAPEISLVRTVGAATTRSDNQRYLYLVTMNLAHPCQAAQLSPCCCPPQKHPLNVGLEPAAAPTVATAAPETATRAPGLGAHIPSGTGPEAAAEEGAKAAGTEVGIGRAVYDTLLRSCMPAVRQCWCHDVGWGLVLATSRQAN
jgi:hypothetical protein